MKKKLFAAVALAGAVSLSAAAPASAAEPPYNTRPTTQVDVCVYGPVYGQVKLVTMPYYKARTMVYWDYSAYWTYDDGTCVYTPPVEPPPPVPAP